MPNLGFVELLGVQVNVAPFDEAVESVLGAPDSGHRLALHFATAHTLVEANGARVSGFAALATSLSLYEILHAIDHWPFEQWGPLIEHPRWGPMACPWSG